MAVLPETIPEAIGEALSCGHNFSGQPEELSDQTDYQLHPMDCLSDLINCPADPMNISDSISDVSNTSDLSGIDPSCISPCSTISSTDEVSCWYKNFWNYV